MILCSCLVLATATAMAPHSGTPHTFWGISTGTADQSLAPNRFTAPNFILSAPATIQKQPGFTHPHPIPKNLSKAMNHTMIVWHQQPVGKKVLTFNGGAPCGNHHPADNIWPIGGKNWNACKHPTTGAHMNFTGLWWDHGAAQIALDWKSTLATLKKMGATTIDFITIDTECDMDAFTVTSWQREYNPTLTPECSDQYFDSIQNDKRFPTVHAELIRHGFVAGDTTKPHWLRDALPWNASNDFNNNLAAWQAVTRAMISAYKTQAYFVPALAAYPSLGGLSDYNEFNWDAEVGCSLQMNGFHANGCTHTSCQECTVGNTASPSMYGWMHNVSDGVNFPGFGGKYGSLAPYGIETYEISPFNSLQWSLYHFRAVRHASPSIPVKPWLAYRSYPGDAGPGDPIVGWVDSDFFQEMILHLGLMGADDFLLFNPCFATCCWLDGVVLPCNATGARPMATLADNKLYSATFDELTLAVGWKEREWVPEATPGGWKCDHLLSAMNTPLRRVWRFTPRDGRPTAHLKQTSTGNVTLTLSQGDYPTVVFTEAHIVSKMSESAPPVSKVGLWIEQELTAPLPDGWRCTS